MRNINVACAAIHRNGRILAVERGYGEQKGGWEFPGGKLEPGESPEDAVRREIKEELLVDIAVEQSLGTAENDYPSFHISLHCFLCSCKGEPVLTEHSASRWLSPDELYSVPWLPADTMFLPGIENYLRRTSQN